MIKLFSNYFVLFFVYPIIFWISIFALNYSHSPETFQYVLSTFLRITTSLSLPITLLGLLSLKASDRLNMGLREQKESGATYVGLVRHIELHSTLKTALEKIISALILVMAVLVPFLVGCFILGGITWYFAKTAY